MVADVKVGSRGGGYVSIVGHDIEVKETYAALIASDHRPTLFLDVGANYGLHSILRAQGARIWMTSEATDMRCGFDRLAERVKTVIGENPQSGHLFVFRSRRGDRLKILVWDRDGFVLWYKRLELGVFKLPRIEQGARSVELRASELAMILDGIDVSKLKRVRRYERAV